MPGGEQNPSERNVVAIVLVGAAVAMSLLLGLLSLAHEGTASTPKAPRDRSAEVEAVAQRWLDAWSAGDVAAMKALAAPPAADLERAVTSFRDGLHVTAVRASTREPEVHVDEADVAVDVALDLDGLGTWAYPGRLHLVLPKDAESAHDWRVAWSRAALHPALTGTRTIATTRAFAPRAPLLAADGTPLTGPGARPTAGLVQQLLGRVGTADADGNGRAAGDPKGVSGLQAAFDAELGGGASGDIVVREGDAVVGTLQHIDGRAPAPVRTSIDLHAQAVAESVLATVTDHPAALVALRPSTGEVVAVTSVPQRGFNRALNGRYPPGSTFKVITSTALLLSGLTPDARISCPHDVRIGGRVFQNAEDEELGDISFATAFAHSCNTAFVQMAERLQPTDLVAAAERYGFNKPSGVETGAEQSSYPAPQGMVDQVSSSIGQGRVLATPLQMASVAATVASGVHRPTTFRAVTGPVAGEAMPLPVIGTLQDFMRRVVGEGTAASARLPGGTAGKTGTAEFGSGNPPQTHAWFIGFRGDLAFAVIVEDGGFGGKVAAPLARAFLSQL